MSQFFQFQRVRKARGVALIGMEAVVVSLQARPDAEAKFDFVVMAVRDELIVKPEGVVSIRKGEIVDAIQNQWEPSLPEDLESPEEIAELNEPAPLRLVWADDRIIGSYIERTDRYRSVWLPPEDQR